MDFSSKNVIVTGAAGGIGYAIANKFLEKGSKVLLTDINLKAVEEAYNNLKDQYGDRVRYAEFCCDVTLVDNIKETFNVCERYLGKPNVLINNAGAGNEKSFRKSMSLNLEAPVNWTEIALEYMGKHKGGQGGNVINLASMAGIKSVPFWPFYCATKTGLVSYTRNIGHPFNLKLTGVNVQCICPIGVNTPLVRNASLDNARDERSYAETMKLFRLPTLQPGDVASALICLLQEGKPGAVMCIQYGKDPYYHEI